MTIRVGAALDVSKCATEDWLSIETLLTCNDSRVFDLDSRGWHINLALVFCMFIRHLILVTLDAFFVRGCNKLGSKSKTEASSKDRQKIATTRPALVNAEVGCIGIRLLV